MKKTFALISIFVVFCMLMITGCESLKTTKIVPMFDPEATVLLKTNAVAYVTNGIVAIAIPLNDVKEVDAFGVVIVNRTNNWISVKEKDCWLLDQSGKGFNTIDESQRSFYLGKNFDPKLPPEFPAEVFRWNRSIRVTGRGFAALLSEDVEKTTVMPGRKKQFFLYFKKQSIQSSKIRLIIPKVHNDYTGEDTTFVFKFQIEKS